MKKFWKKDKPQELMYYCESGHEFGKVFRINYYDPVTKEKMSSKWLCPYCIIEFANNNIAGVNNETRSV